MALSRYEWASGGWLLDRRARIALTQAAWMTIVLGALVALDRFSAESYFVLSFLGLLAVLQIFAPPTDEIEEVAVIRWIKIVGFLAFGYIILGRIAAVV